MRHRRHGVILVTAIWVIIVLLALVLIFARETRVELTASANRVWANQAAAVELGAEQYVIAAVDASAGNAISVLQTPAEQIRIGSDSNPAGDSSTGGYFWILQDYFDNDTTYAFGITDENSKLNLNVATDTALATLPGIPQEIADSIVLWRGGQSSSTTGQGADTSYYNSLPRPYALKAAPFESVDELYVLKDMTDTILYGSDLDHNGMLDTNEQNIAGLASSFNSASDASRGIFPFVTVWGKEPNSNPATGKARINVGTITSTTALRATLTAAGLTEARVNQIVGRAEGIRIFRNVFDFAAKTQMTAAELAMVEYDLTTTTAKTLPGLINVNTAPLQVLEALPGLTQDDAQSIVSQRAANSGSAGSSSTGNTSTSTTNTSAAWMLSAIAPPKAAAIGSLITGQSYFFSADIIAVAATGTSSPSDGAGGAVGFKRVRIVVDARSSPPVIVYRKDLTYLGWPLDPLILANLKSHKPLPAPSGYGTGGANGLSQQL
jgi:type II secretory pathway component PulK